MSVSIFQVTTPLYIRCGEDNKQLIGEFFPHPQGMLIFDPFWFESEQIDSVVHLIKGNIEGAGPWKIAHCTISTLGCRDEDLSLEASQWQEFLDLYEEKYRAESGLTEIALSYGAII